MIRRARLAATTCALVLTLTLMAGCSALPLPLPNLGRVGPFTETGGTTPSTLPVPSRVYDDGNSPDRYDISPPPTATPPGFADPPPGAGYDKYFTQTVNWGSCGSGRKGDQCAHVLAPLDWQNPDGQAITLTMKRKSATTAIADPSSPDLFINPGGPGGSAQDYVDYFDTTGLTGYNIVGLDPRGSGESTPVVCGTTAQIDAYFNLDMAPQDDAGKQALVDGTRTFAQQCRENSGDLLDHISTIEAVYDFDMVRQVLGDEKFNWLGTSYGTFIGAVYLELYPNNAGRMVLDAAVNIVQSNGNSTDPGGISQADGFELALTKFAEWEVSTGRATSVDSFKTKLTDFIESLRDNPIQVGNRTLTQSLFVTGLAMFMYSGTSIYSQLATALKAAIDNRNGYVMLAAADQMNGRTANGYDSLATAFPAISCKDWSDPGIAIMYQMWQSESQSAPIFGTYFGPNLVCSVWTVQSAVQINFSGAGDPPFLVIGGTGDNATPYQYAKSMAKQMPSAILVTRDGVGHGSYSSGSSCIDTIVRDFLVKGTTPTSGTTCKMD
ncbi:MAG: alpha/beta hydrolase [Propionibacteriaceae bacterium]|nr:alpha/beta hydrolase [Propionibacteriaceae bacterium]